MISCFFSDRDISPLEFIDKPFEKSVQVCVKGLKSPGKLKFGMDDPFSITNDCVKSQGGSNGRS